MHPDPNRTESQIGRLTLTVEEVAQMLGLSRSATYEAIARGEIPSLRFGRRIVVTRRALHRLLGHGDASIELPSGRQI
jgi:excisionase family DNA binding protein